MASPLTGMIWSAIERFSLQGVRFLLGIVLARLLAPSDYGIMGMLAVFLNLSQVLIDGGFANALIRQKHPGEDDFNTVFVTNMAISCGIYLVLFVAAPWIASFYAVPDLEPVVRAVALSLIINAACALHRVKLTIAIDFKTQSKCTFAAALLSGLVGIFLAWRGLGVWSLVWQTLLNSFLSLVFLAAVMRWFPRPHFSRQVFRRLFSYGSKLLAGSVLNSIYANLYSVVIGRKFSPADVGFYNRADQLAAFPSSNFGDIVSRVTFPVLAKVQDDPERLKATYAKYLQVMNFITFPVMMALCALAHPLIILLLGVKWEPAAVLFQLLCLDCMFDPTCLMNLNLLYVKGRSDLALRLELIKKPVAIGILVLSIPAGITGMCAGRAIYGLLAVLLNTYFVGRAVKLTWLSQLRLMTPYLLLSCIMAVGVWWTTGFISGAWLKFSVGMLLAAALYGGMAYFFRLDALRESARLVRRVWRRIPAKT